MIEQGESPDLKRVRKGKGNLRPNSDMAPPVTRYDNDDANSIQLQSSQKKTLKRKAQSITISKNMQTLKDYL